MASQFQARVFDTELHLHSLRKLFEQDVPTGAEAFNRLKAAFDANELPTLEFEGRKLYVHEFYIDGDWVTILFHLTDPSIRDRDYSNLREKTLRTAARLAGEEPAFSSHVLINISARGDLRRSYPCVIEEAEALSRTLIGRALNMYLKRFYNEERYRPAKKDTKTFQISAQLRAPLDQTVEGMLLAGERLEEIKFVEDGLADVVHGDEAYQVTKERHVRLKVEGKPSKDRARDLLGEVVP